MGVRGSAAAGRIDVRADRPKIPASRSGVLRLIGAGETGIKAVPPAGREGSAVGTRWPGQATSRQAVEIAHLRKTYGALVAVDDVSFAVTEGEIFGILGPNGAGKTTTVECAIGLRSPDSGTIRLLGLDPHADADKIHEIVGVNSRRARCRTS